MIKLSYDVLKYRNQILSLAQDEDVTSSGYSTERTKASS